MRFLASEVAAVTGGELIGPDVPITGAGFDSRSTSPEMLFVPIVAERDGHDFIGHAARSGAAAAFTSRDNSDGSIPLIRVDSTTESLSALAHAFRHDQHHGPDVVVAITGSVGKTTTKDFVAGALAAYGVHAASASLNNDIGVPITLLNAPDGVATCVLEMGMRGMGEIERLCQVAQPDIGVVTRVGEAHTARLGGLDGVAQAKGELVEALPPSGTAVLNIDDDRVAAMATRTTAHIVTYGVNGDVRARVCDVDDVGRHRVVIDSPWGSAEVVVPLPGAHMVSNVLAAASVCGVVTSSLDGVAGLGMTSVSAHRMAVHQHGPVTLIDDCYNANPTSMMAALDTLHTDEDTECIAILGPMAEVADSNSAHRAIALYAERLGVRIIPVGTSAYGLPPATDLVGEALDGPQTRPRRILVKASRSAQLERVVDALLERLRS